MASSVHVTGSKNKSQQKEFEVFGENWKTLLQVLDKQWIESTFMLEWNQPEYCCTGTHKKHGSAQKSHKSSALPPPTEPPLHPRGGASHGQQGLHRGGGINWIGGAWVTGLYAGRSSGSHWLRLPFALTTHITANCRCMCKKFHKFWSSVLGCVSPPKSCINWSHDVGSLVSNNWENKC